MPFTPIPLYGFTTDLRAYYFDFSKMPEIVGGDTIASVVSLSVISTPSDLTLGSTAISGAKVSVIISGGSANTIYTIRCLVALASGLHLSWEGQLEINA